MPSADETLEFGFDSLRSLVTESDPPAPAGRLSLWTGGPQAPGAVLIVAERWNPAGAYLDLSQWSGPLEPLVVAPDDADTEGAS